MSTSTVYEIINPSDAYTFRSDDEAAAALACLFLGEGAYGLKTRDGRRACPMFILGGNPDKWCRETFGTDIDDLMKTKRLAVADALDSVIIGGFGDREDVEAATATMTPDQQKAYLENRHDRRRSSLNDIGKRAKSLAKAVRWDGNKSVDYCHVERPEKVEVKP